MTTILYVEDHPPAQLLMQAIISDLTDYTLLLAHDGADALRQAATGIIDLYILDFDLPDTDGMALARALHEVQPAPVILVSAYAEAIDADTCADFQCDYLAKPLDPDDVAAALQRSLARRR